MAHRYSQPITPLPETSSVISPEASTEISLEMAGSARPLSAFTWRGQTYTVRAVLAQWHLEARWWERAFSDASYSAPADTAQRPNASDRYYYRLACMPDDLLCEVYYDAHAGAWMLDVVYD